MPPKSNGALRAERERIERARRIRREAKIRSRRRRHADEHTPTRRDRYVAASAARG